MILSYVIIELISLSKARQMSEMRVRVSLSSSRLRLCTVECLLLTMPRLLRIVRLSVLKLKLALFSVAFISSSESTLLNRSLTFLDEAFASVFVSVSASARLMLRISVRLFLR